MRLIIQRVFIFYEFPVVSSFSICDGTEAFVFHYENTLKIFIHNIVSMSHIITVFYNNDFDDDEINILTFIKSNLKTFNGKNFKFTFIEKENIKDLIFQYNGTTIETNKVIVFLKNILLGNTISPQNKPNQNNLRRKPDRGINPLERAKLNQRGRRLQYPVMNNAAPGNVGDSDGREQKIQENSALLNSTSSQAGPSIGDDQNKPDGSIPIQTSKTLSEYVKKMSDSEHFSAGGDENYKMVRFSLDENNSCTNI